MLCLQSAWVAVECLCSSVNAWKLTFRGRYISFYSLRTEGSLPSGARVTEQVYVRILPGARIDTVCARHERDAVMCRPPHAHRSTPSS